MQRLRLTAATLAVVLAGMLLAACSDDPACAAPTPTPFDALRMPAKPPAPRPPALPRYTYKPPHAWGPPYGKSRPIPAQPCQPPPTEGTPRT